jgi:hypothetical protein
MFSEQGAETHPTLQYLRYLCIFAFTGYLTTGRVE